MLELSCGFRFVDAPPNISCQALLIAASYREPPGGRLRFGLLTRWAQHSVAHPGAVRFPSHAYCGVALASNHASATVLCSRASHRSRFLQGINEGCGGEGIFHPHS